MIGMILVDWVRSVTIKDDREKSKDQGQVGISNNIVRLGTTRDNFGQLGEIGDD